MTLQVKISKQTNFLFQSVIAIVHDLQPFYLVGIISNPAVNSPKTDHRGNTGFTSSISSPVQVYCDMDRTRCCNTAEGWMRVV